MNGKELATLVGRLKASGTVEGRDAAFIVEMQMHAIKHLQGQLGISAVWTAATLGPEHDLTLALKNSIASVDTMIRDMPLKGTYE